MVLVNFASRYLPVVRSKIIQNSSIRRKKSLDYKENHPLPRRPRRAVVSMCRFVVAVACRRSASTWWYRQSSGIRRIDGKLRGEFEFGCRETRKSQTNAQWEPISFRWVYCSEFFIRLEDQARTLHSLLQSDARPPSVKQLSTLPTPDISCYSRVHGISVRKLFWSKTDRMKESSSARSDSFFFLKEIINCHSDDAQYHGR